jgi:glycosyltransferase involved in cell wall biosynthesis
MTMVALRYGIDMGIRRVDLSIIIPTFNRIWSLPEAIASCPRGDNIEIIVVDDGSTDGTWEWLSTQPGITAIRQVNWGKPAAVNAGFAVARGTYVRFLDSDDLLIADSVVAQLAFALQHEPDICVAGYRALYVGSGIQIAHPWADCGDFLSQQLGECDSSHYSAYLFGRSFLDDIPHRPEFAFRDDRMFILECAMKLPTVLAWDQPTLIHRHHDNQRIQFQPGSTAVVTNWQELQMHRKVLRLLDHHGLATPRRKAAMSNNVWELARRIGAYDQREGLDVLDWYRTINPAFVIPSGGQNSLYRSLGYRPAQTIVNMARFARNTGRKIRRLGR